MRQSVTSWKKLDLQDDTNESDCLIKAMDNSRKRYEMKYGTFEKTTKKIYRLQFSGNVKLSGKVLAVNQNPDADETQDPNTLVLGGYTIVQEVEGMNDTDTFLEKTFCNTTKVHTHVKRHVVYCTPKLYWRVANDNVEAFLSGPSSAKPKKKKGTAAARALRG